MKTVITPLTILVAIIILYSCGAKEPSTVNNNYIKVEESSESETIKIGTQNWCVKNLDVETYSNGDEIPQVQDKKEWSKLKCGAWCYYENKTENGTTYGKMYNSYALIDKRGLAPKGFHIPTKNELAVLIEYLGGESEAGSKLKSDNGWVNLLGDTLGLPGATEASAGAAAISGTNSSKFNGRPGGSRTMFGDFSLLGSGGNWWSSTSGDPHSFWTLSLFYYNGSAYLGMGGFDGEGHYVRCLRD